MVRVLHIENKFLEYLKSFDTNISWSIGLIIGQSYENKDYGVHLCKTALSECNVAVKIKSISDINELWVSEHAKQATRMLPGGIHILGLFIISDNETLTPFPTKLKSILAHLHKSLTTTYLYGNSNHNDKLIVNYCSRSNKMICKYYDIITCNVKPGEYEIIKEQMKWNNLSCKYWIEEMYQLEEENYDMDLKRHINVILQDFHNNLKSAIILFDGELKGDEEIVELTQKKKKIPLSGKMTYTDANIDDKQTNITILQRCDKEKYKNIIVNNTDYQIKIIGHIYSAAWLHPNASYKMATEALIHDIMRSLSTRLEMHWDSLIEEEQKRDLNTIHEPPRRVMISLPGCKVKVCDYLFPGEGPEEIQNSISEIFDISLSSISEHIENVEAPVDLSAFYNNKPDEKICNESKDQTKLLYIGGLIFALFVLISSVILHFVFKD